MSEEQEPRVAGAERRRIDDPLVHAVARLPLKVRAKMLIAFVGTSLLLVAVGLLGQIVLGQSNDRVGSVGPLQRRAVAYGQLQTETDAGVPGNWTVTFNFYGARGRVDLSLLRKAEDPD